MPVRWSLQRWDLRAWCTSDTVFARVSASLLKVTELQEDAIMAPLTNRTDSDKAARRVNRAAMIPGLALGNTSAADMEDDVGGEMVLWECHNAAAGESAVASLLGELAAATKYDR